MCVIAGASLRQVRQALSGPSQDSARNPNTTHGQVGSVGLAVERTDWGLHLRGEAKKGGWMASEGDWRLAAPGVEDGGEFGAVAPVTAGASKLRLPGQAFQSYLDLAWVRLVARGKSNDSCRRM